MALWLGKESHHAETARRELSRSFEYQREVERLASLMKDAETGQRGYLIAGDPAFLQPYEEARAGVDEQIVRVDQLTPANGPQRADLTLLKQLIAAKFTEMQALLDVHHRAGAEAAAVRLRQGLGKRLMDDIRRVVDRMDRRGVDHVEAARQRETDRRARNAATIWWAIALIAIAAAIAGFLMGRSARLRSQLAIENEEQAARRRAVFDAVTDGLITVNPSGSIEKVNPAGERIFGYSTDALLRRDISTIIDIAPGEGSFLERVGLRDGELQKTELLDFPGHTAEGENISLDIVMGTMPLPDGVHIVLAVRDATARKEIDRLKDDFISTVSHELRTPLTSVVGSLGLLRSGAAGQLPVEAQRLAEIAETNSQRLIRLINDILDIDQIRKGRMAFDYAVIDLRDVMTKAVDAMQGLADRREIQIEAQVPSNPVMACADADRLVQVASNLLSNAIKFSPEGSVVRFELHEGQEDHVIQVTDQGPGIDPDFASSIFSRFAQSARPNRQMIAGTGLGLAISREIVRSHGGEISFENRREGGARFAFSIPRDSAYAANVNGSARLLICEDDHDAGRTIQSILTAHGYASDLVTTVRDAIAHARAHPYNAILLDLTLADADGMDVMRGLRSDGSVRTPPVIVISGLAPPTDLDDMNGYAGWLQKPFDPPRLIQLIQRAIRRSDQRKAVILHIDDDDDTRELFSAALAGRGLLLSATSLATARMILAERRPDVIVLDLGLPDGSGGSLLAEVKEGDNPLPVVVYSAQEIDEATRRLADAVLVKSRRALPKLASTILDIVDRHGGPQ
ncbi:histidine kinase [Rhizorhabdus dicambivorans]|uniref:histidine kinase n=2 Tax=Rhizorhabdus dicambivorans TaxID=1850238 RepID=A0A2A4FSV6_9SPHN|nr:histidine kinase [Rhizorhabdus dicambivorans]PCE40774.1 histidine kinase [Rhizorhabdus dicambivorans]